jgi:hypothetical protein
LNNKIRLVFLSSVSLGLVRDRTDHYILVLYLRFSLKS